MFIVYVMELSGYKIVIDQSLALYAIYKHLGFALGSHAYILHTNLKSGQKLLHTKY